VSHSSLLFDGFELVDQGLFIRKLTCLQFRVDQLAIGSQLKTAAATRNQFQILDLLLELAQQFGRQTDGLGFVVSHRAVSKFQVHVPSSPLRWGDLPTEF